MFQSYQTDPEFRAYVQLWGLVGTLAFILLLGLLAYFGDTYWLLTAIVLVITLSAISILGSVSGGATYTAATWLRSLAATVLTAVVSVGLAELLYPERDLTQHFTALLNPAWVILGLYWALVRGAAKRQAVD